MIFLERWDDKQSPLQVLSEYNNLKKGGFESFHEFSSRFMRAYNSIANDIKPSPGAGKLHYVEAFDNDFSLLLRERKLEKRMLIGGKVEKSYPPHLLFHHLMM